LQRVRRDRPVGTYGDGWDLSQPTFDEKHNLIITIFLKKNLSNEERFYMAMLEITGPSSIIIPSGL
jgi:hypothetical protein